MFLLNGWAYTKHWTGWILYLVQNNLSMDPTFREHAMYWRRPTQMGSPQNVRLNAGKYKGESKQGCWNIRELDEICIGWLEMPFWEVIFELRYEKLNILYKGKYILVRESIWAKVRKLVYSRNLYRMAHHPEDERERLVGNKIFQIGNIQTSGW